MGWAGLRLASLELCPWKRNQTFALASILWNSSEVIIIIPFYLFITWISPEPCARNLIFITRFKLSYSQLKQRNKTYFKEQVSWGNTVLKWTTNGRKPSLKYINGITHFFTKETPFWMLPASSFFAFSKPALLINRYDSVLLNL